LIVVFPLRCSQIDWLWFDTKGSGGFTERHSSDAARARSAARFADHFALSGDLCRVPREALSKFCGEAAATVSALQPFTADPTATQIH
jgi:hypothetical protein